MHAVFDLPLEGFLHLEQPHHYRNAPPGVGEEEFSDILAAELAKLIEYEGADTLAAMIAEPVMGAGGVIVPPQGYFERILPLLRQHDILFIADEVICGFGRLGAPFGSDYYGLEPDLMSVAKGLTSGCIPMSACLVSDPVWEVLRVGSKEHGPFSHGYTYSGHPVAAATALANLDVIEKEGLIDNAATIGAYFQERLRSELAPHPLVGEVRGVGLVAGVELVASKAEKRPFDPENKVGRRLSRLALEDGVIVRAIRDTLAFSPPLVIEKRRRPTRSFTALAAGSITSPASSRRRAPGTLGRHVLEQGDRTVLKIYHVPGTRSLRVIWLCEELGHPYEVVPIDFSPEYRNRAEWRALSPTGKVPAMSDDGFSMFESGAMVQYILQRYADGRLQPPPGSAASAIYLQLLVRRGDPRPPPRRHHSPYAAQA